MLTGKRPCQLRVSIGVAGGQPHRFARFRQPFVILGRGVQSPGHTLMAPGVVRVNLDGFAPFGQALVIFGFRTKSVGQAFVGGDVIGIKLEGFAFRGFGAVGVIFPNQRPTEHGIGLGIRGREAHRFPSFGRARVILCFHVQRLRQGEVEIRGVGVEADGPTRFHHGLIELPLVNECQATPSWYQGFLGLKRTASRYSAREPS